MYLTYLENVAALCFSLLICKVGIIMLSISLVNF